MDLVQPGYQVGSLNALAGIHLLLTWLPAPASSSCRSLNALAGIHLLLTDFSSSDKRSQEIRLNALAGIHLLLTYGFCVRGHLLLGLNALAGIHLLLTEPWQALQQGHWKS